MSKEVKLIISFNITNESFNSDTYKKFVKDFYMYGKELIKHINFFKELPGCSDAKVEVIALNQ